MKDNYLNNIKNLIERNIIEQTKHQIKSNSHKLITYHNIGKELIEAEKDVENKYGAAIVKNYAKKLREEYGNSYDYTSLTRKKRFYLIFPNIATVSQQSSNVALPAQLSWSHFVEVLPIKDENKRNYYLNLVVEHNLSKMKLREQIKSNAFERLSNKNNIELKFLEEEQNGPDIMDMIKNPILISVNKSFDKLTEKVLKELLLE